MSIRVNKIFVCLLMLMLLCGCTRNFEINDPAKVTIQRADEFIEITDPDTINKLTEQITSMTFKRGQSTKDMTGWEYWLIWYDENGNQIFNAFIAPQGIDYKNRFWNCENGTIDTAYYDELLQ